MKSGIPQEKEKLRFTLKCDPDQGPLYHGTFASIFQACERAGKKLKATLQKFNTQAEPHKYGNQLLFTSVK